VAIARRPHRQLPPLTLTPGEASALVASLVAVGRDISAAAQTALGKLLTALTNPALEQTEQLEQHRLRRNRGPALVPDARYPHLCDAARRRHWWNGKWGRLARRDVLLYHDDESGRLSVEAREGGADGDSLGWDLAREPDALELINSLTEDSSVDQRRELPTG
jgi:hypothetical protein